MEQKYAGSRNDLFHMVMILKNHHQFIMVIRVIWIDHNDDDDDDDGDDVDCDATEPTILCCP